MSMRVLVDTSLDPMKPSPEDCYRVAAALFNNQIDGVNTIITTLSDPTDYITSQNYHMDMDVAYNLLRTATIAAAAVANKEGASECA